MELFYILGAALVISGAIFVAIKNSWKAGLIFAGMSFGGLLLGFGNQAIFATIVKNDQETFYEYWGGSEISATKESVECYRDGMCVNTFQCDPYTVTDIEYYTDSDGNTQSRTVTRTEYHSCPYSTEETSYKVATTVGDFSFGSNLMTGEEFRWGHPIPGGRVTEDPADWVEAKKRIDSGNPGPAFKKSSYKNYILASQHSILKRYAESVEDLRESGLLPSFSVDIRDHYRGTKLYYAGVDSKLISEKAQAALMEDVEKLSAAAGAELGADLRVVLVDASKVKNPYKYSNSIHSYWQSPEFGRDALPKNAAVFVIGVKPYEAPAASKVDKTDESSDKSVDSSISPEKSDAKPEDDVVAIGEGTPVVAWADFFSGMPVGNEKLKQEVRSSLLGVPVDDSFVGVPTYNVESDSYSFTEGAIYDALFGANKFERESMSAEHENDKGSGFKYLSNVRFDTGHYVAMWIINFVLLSVASIFGWKIATEFDK